MAQSHQRPFTRRQLAVIAKIAFIEAMALSLIIPTISSTGEIPTDFQSMRMGHTSCVITTGQSNCITTVFFIPNFPINTMPNVTIADVTNNGAAFGFAQQQFTGQTDFMETNTSMSINIPKSCSLATPCDLTLFNQNQLSLVGMGQQLFQFHMLCLNSNYTGSISLEVYSSPSTSGTFKETGENLGIASGTCNIPPVALIQDSTAQTDVNPDCVNTSQAVPCFYKIRIVNSPSTTVAHITFKKFYLSFYENIPLIPLFTPQPGDNTQSGIVVQLPITTLSSINSPFIINFTWVAVECTTSLGYKAGNC